MKRILILLLTLLLTCSAVACGSQESEDKSYAIFDEFVGQEIMLYDYEEISDFQEINTTPGFGITEMNKNLNYVKSGKGSMHVRVDGYALEDFYHYPEHNTVHRQLIEMYPNWYFAEKSDYSDALCFKLDVFNVSDRDVNVGLRVFTSVTDVALEPKVAIKDKWTELTFVIDHEKAIYQGFDSVTKMSFFFDNKVQGQTSAELYLDNFRYIKGANKSKKISTIPEMKDNVLCDFEDKFFEVSALTMYSSYPNIGVYDGPRISINTDSRFVSSGSKSLKITRFPSYYNHQLFPAWSDVYPLHSDYLYSIDWSQFEVKNTEIWTDVYNDFDENVTIRFYVLDKNDQGIMVDTSLKPNAWTTVKLPMGKNLMMDWNNVGVLNVMFMDFYGVKNCNVYLDNMRFVVVK